jgi:hypothetical protein
VNKSRNRNGGNYRVPYILKFILQAINENEITEMTAGKV